MQKVCTIKTQNFVVEFLYEKSGSTNLLNFFSNSIFYDFKSKKKKKTSVPNKHFWTFYKNLDILGFCIFFNLFGQNSNQILFLQNLLIQNE